MRDTCARLCVDPSRWSGLVWSCSQRFVRVQPILFFFFFFLRMRGAVVGWSRLKVEKRLFRVMAAEELPTSPRLTFERLRAILRALLLPQSRHINFKFQCRKTFMTVADLSKRLQETNGKLRQFSTLYDVKNEFTGLPFARFSCFYCLEVSGVENSSSEIS